MKTAVFADLHDNVAGLTAVLDDAAEQRVNDFVFLGDAGHSPRLYAALQARRIPCVFGNWEVSGLRRLQPPLAEWVGGWPASIRRNGAVYCHATPDMPTAIVNTGAAVAALRPGMSWSTLFPRLHQDETARWRAFAWLETHDVQVAFHGHTHVQMVHTWQPATSALHTSTRQSEILLQPATRYVIGVGSAGSPDDGPHLRYAIYDSAANLVKLRQIQQ